MAKINTRPTRSPVAPKDVETLGTVGGWTFVVHAGREYVMDLGPLPSGGTVVPMDDDELRIAERVEGEELGTRTLRTVTRRGRLVDSGTYAAMVEREASRRRPGPRSARPVDLIARQPRFAPRADRVVPAPTGRRDLPLAAASDGDRELAGVLLTAVPPAGGFLPGVRPTADLASVMHQCEREGVTLAVSPAGRLLVFGPAGRVVDDLLIVVRLAERLIVGRLTGHPVKCELWHPQDAPPASTILALDTPACVDHAAGTLPIVDIRRAGAA